MLPEVEYRRILLTLAWFLDNDTSEYLWSWLEPRFEMRLVKKGMDQFIKGASKNFEFFCKRAEVDISLAEPNNGSWVRWGWDPDRSFSTPNLDACPQPMRFGLKNRINGSFRFQGRIPDINSPYTMWDIVDTKRDRDHYYIDGICVGVTSLPPWAAFCWALCRCCLSNLLCCHNACLCGGLPEKTWFAENVNPP